MKYSLEKDNARDSPCRKKSLVFCENDSKDMHVQIKTFNSPQTKTPVRKGRNLHSKRINRTTGIEGHLKITENNISKLEDINLSKTYINENLESQAKENVVQTKCAVATPKKRSIKKTRVISSPVIKSRSNLSSKGLKGTAGNKSATQSRK